MILSGQPLRKGSGKSFLKEELVYENDLLVAVSQLVESLLAKQEVAGSSPVCNLHFTGSRLAAMPLALGASIQRRFESSLPDITFFRGVVGSTQEFDSCRLGPSPGGRNKAKVIPIKKGNYWFESNISPFGRNCLQPALIWAVRITVYYAGFASPK